MAGPVLFTDKTSAAHASLLAWGAAILNVAAGSGKITYLRKYCQEENTFSLSVVSILFVTVCYLVMLPSNPMAMPPLNLAILFVGGCIGAIGCIAYIRAFQIAKAALISATQYSQIIWAVLMGVFIFRENLTISAICGSLLIITSGYLLYLRKDISKES
jgi:drug/metabolite transporter (DMT)-like permease